MAVRFVLSSATAFEGCGFHATNGPDGACYDSRKMGEAPMDSLEQRDPATEEPVEQILDREWEQKTAERRDERPSVEPFDPYFGRRRKEVLAWF